MSISAMKCALQSLESVEKVKGWNKDSIVGRHCTQSAHFLRQAIAEAEKQEPMNVDPEKPDHIDHPMRHWDRTCPACVYESDISQEPVDETAKREHEFEEMVKKGTKAWDGVPDDWVDDLRGGAEKQEPMAFRNTETGEFCTGGFLRKDWAKWQPLYAAPVQARPVVHAVRCTYPQCQATNGCVGACSKGQPDLARVGEVGVWGDKREWVGLTDEEVDEWTPEIQVVIHAIEAKLKEKNT